MKKILSSAVIFTITALASAMTMANEHQHHHDAHHEHHTQQSSTQKMDTHHGHHGHHHHHHGGVARADGHAPAGVMFDHMHGKGSFMVGYNAQRLVQDGAYYTGENKVDMSTTGYARWGQKHDMTMHMLHFMYGVTDNLTLTLMPMYMKMDMDMQDGSGYKGSHGTEGWGDTVIGASSRLFTSADKKHDVMATLAVSAPTGSYKEKLNNTMYQPYGMQLGAGIWQVLPNLTYQYNEGDLKAGVQLSARLPLEKTNDLGFYKGQQISGTAWLSYSLMPRLSVSTRIQHSKTDDVRGAYNMAMRPNTPAFQPANYGGRQTLAGIGINTTLPANVRLGVEYMQPVYNKVNGVQQDTDNIMYLSISKALK